MRKAAEISQTELALILEALDDAAYYRDAHSRVLTSAARRYAKRQGSAQVAPADAEGHRGKARAYADLARRLKAAREQS